jgi:hypothetical protein
MIWYKQGVVGDLNNKPQKALGKVGRLASAQGEDVFVTSIRDSLHSMGSLHLIGDAWDQRPLINVSVEEVRTRLGQHFDVVDEGDHWHIEYDPKD